MQDSLNEKIISLKKELEQISIENSDAKDHINALIEEIEGIKDQSSEDNTFIINKLKRSIENFETEHPRATAILNDIMVTLSNIGI
jgi:seryl-tRNA synthetase